MIWAVGIAFIGVHLSYTNINDYNMERVRSDIYSLLPT